MLTFFTPLSKFHKIPHNLTNYYFEIEICLLGANLSFKFGYCDCRVFRKKTANGNHHQTFFLQSTWNGQTPALSM